MDLHQLRSQKRHSVTHCDTGADNFSPRPSAFADMKLDPPSPRHEEEELPPRESESQLLGLDLAASAASATTATGKTGQDEVLPLEKKIPSAADPQPRTTSAPPKNCAKSSSSSSSASSSKAPSKRPTSRGKTAALAPARAAPETAGASLPVQVREVAFPGSATPAAWSFTTSAPRSPERLRHDFQAQAQAANPAEQSWSSASRQSLQSELRKNLGDMEGAKNLGEKARGRWRTRVQAAMAFSSAVR